MFQCLYITSSKYKKSKLATFFYTILYFLCKHFIMTKHFLLFKTDFSHHKMYLFDKVTVY